MIKLIRDNLGNSIKYFFKKKTVDQLWFSFQKNMCARWSQRKLKISHIFYWSHIPISVISVVLHYEQLYRAPTSVNDEILLEYYFGTLNFDSFSQKQPFRGVLSKRCSENIQQIYKRTVMSKCDFNKVAQ